MFDLPNSSNVERVVVDESTIDENKPPLLVYREAARRPDKAPRPHLYVLSISSAL